MEDDRLALHAAAERHALLNPGATSPKQSERMSDELRTLLNAILGFGQLLELNAENQNERESIEQIFKAGHTTCSILSMKCSTFRASKPGG